MRISNITIGSDPEVFLVNKQGKPVSSIGIIPGTKEEAYKIDNNGHSLQIDNVAAEYTISPCKTKEEWIKEHEFMLRFIREYISPKNLDILLSPSEEFTEEELNDPIAQILGCSSDNDSWQQKVNEKPDATNNFRSAAFHVHIGFDNPTIEYCEELSKAFDLFVTLPSLLIDNNEKAIRRRELYGKAGCFRLQPHGVECRTLSNFPLKSKELLSWVWDNTFLAIDYVNRGKTLSLKTQLGKTIFNTINNNDIKMAEKIIKKFNIPLPVNIQEYAEV